MRTEKVELAKVKKYVVNCEPNDPVDIKCGGPATVGFDFFVDADKDPEKVKKFIKNCLKESGRPCMSIEVTGEQEVRLENVWSEERISECITFGY